MELADLFIDLFDQTVWIKICASLIAGASIGLERQLRGKAVGIRTSCLVCLSTMMYAHICATSGATSNEFIRAITQLATGVGFFGAGLMFTQDGAVNGVTSAAAVWLLAAVGVCIGSSRLGLALELCALAIIILVGVGYLEKSFQFLRRGVHAHIFHLPPKERKK